MSSIYRSLLADVRADPAVLAGTGQGAGPGNAAQRQVLSRPVLRRSLKRRVIGVPLRRKKHTEAELWSLLSGARPAVLPAYRAVPDHAEYGFAE